MYDAPRHHIHRPPGPHRTRGPRKDRPDEWYWRIWFRDTTVWTGWETEKGVTVRAAELVAGDSFVPASDGRPRTVGELLKVWAAVTDQPHTEAPLG